MACLRELATTLVSLALVTLVGGCGDDPPGSANESGGSGGGDGGKNVAGGNAAGGGAGGASAGMASVAGTGGAGAPSGGTPATGGGGAGGSSAMGGSACAGKTYKLCEDFESGQIGGLPKNWTELDGYGPGSVTDVALSGEQFHSGKLALESNTQATGQTRAQHSLADLGATASKHWGRIFYRVDSPAAKPDSGVLHVTFVGLMGTGENRVVDIVEDDQGKHQWLYNNPDDKGSLGSGYDWSFDAEWHCAEWFVDVGAKSYRFFHDSEEVPAIGFTGKADAQMSSYGSVIVGAEFYQVPPKPFVVWFDDLAIDDNRVGCQ
jgi:hypothetical protein